MAPKKPTYSHWMFAHRGGSAEAPENTLVAFQNTKKKELSQGLEMDVRLTKCGELIVCHDEDLLRLCGDPRKVRDVYYEHLPKFL